MKIGYDAKRAVSNMTGLGNYSRLVIEGMAESFTEDSLLLYTPKMKENPRLGKIATLSNVEFRLPPSQGFKGGLWRTFGIPNNLRADGIELYHGLSNELPLTIKSAGVPSVLTVHDLIYRRLPECYKPIDRVLYDYKYGRSCRNADRIIAISECTKRDIMEFYGVAEEKIDIVYQGCDSSFRRVWSQDEIADLRKRYDLPARYLLQVGTIEKRKNLELSVRAMSQMDRDIYLVVVGRDHYGYKERCVKIAEEVGVADRIKFYEGLPFVDLPGFNQAAEVILYPSRYEGFGIPVLEGLESGRPVVAATGSCLEEAGGAETLYVSPDDPRDLASAILSLLRGGREVEYMVKAGKEHAAKFDPAGMVSTIREVYARTIEEYRKR